MRALFEKTLVLLKPDAIERGLMLTLLNELSFPALKMRLFEPDPHIWVQHYAEHEGKDFYGRLIAHMSSGPILAMIVYGIDAIHVVRQKSMDLRCKYGTDGPRNLIHTSDSVESAAREIAIWEALL